MEQLMPSLAHRLKSDSLLRNSIFIMTSTVITSGVGYLYWVVIAHLYSTADIGLASAFISAMTITSIFSNSGTGSALVQVLPRREAGYEWSLTLNACMVMGIVASLPGSIIVAIALPFISPQFALVRYYTAYILIFIIGTVLSTVATLLDQTFVAERAASKMAVRNAAFALLKLLIVVPLVQVGALGIFSSWVLALAATVILSVLVILPRLKRSYRLARRGILKHMRLLFSSFAGHHFINIGGILPMYLLPVFVSIRLSVTDNAYFYTTWMTGGLFFMISSSVATALFSEGSHAAKEVMRQVRASMVIIALLLCPIMLVFLLGSRYILFVFGPGYPQHGLSLLILLTISAVPDAITNIYVSLLRVQGRLRQAALLNLGMAAITLALAWILLPLMGIVGVGWAWLVAESIGSLIVGVDCFIFRGRNKSSSDVSVFQRLTLRNVAGFYRYLVLRLRFHNLRVGLFFLDRGSEIHVSPKAHIRFGRGIRFMRDFTGHFHGDVTVGDDVFFNRSCYIAVKASLVIGNYCLFGEGVSIHDENHIVGAGPEPIATRGFVAKPIVIGNNVWVGTKATILPGVHIGDNAVIGANAVVTHDIPANTIVGGIPARILRKLAPSTQTAAMNGTDMQDISLISTTKLQIAGPSSRWIKEEDISLRDTVTLQVVVEGKTDRTTNPGASRKFHNRKYNLVHVVESKRSKINDGYT